MPSPRLPLVLLPGLLNDARLFQHQIAELDDIAIPAVGDLAGADSMQSLAAQVLGRITEPRFVLAGFSMGGYVSFEIMRVAQERVLGLALIDTSARPDTPESTRLRREAMAAAERDFPGVVDAMIRRIVHPDRVEDPAIVEPMHAMARRVGVAAFVRQQNAIIERPDSRPALRTIECPTLLLCGRQDPVAPVEAHEEMRDGIRDARLVVLGECGHLSPLERPRPVADALRAFIERIAREAT
jgi:pimeloyl-ACP methyl ester carboxylesterase